MFEVYFFKPSPKKKKKIFYLTQFSGLHTEFSG